MPGGHLGYGVQGVATTHEGPQLPIHLHQPLPSLSSRASIKSPSCAPDTPVKSDRVRTTSSTGLVGGSASNLLPRAKEARSHVPAGTA